MDEKARIKENRYGDATVEVAYHKSYRSEAIMAQQIVERWALVAAIPDGEDSAGRTSLRLVTPEELVTRAFDIAQRFRAEAEKRNLTLALPDLEDYEKAKATTTYGKASE